MDRLAEAKVCLFCPQGMKLLDIKIIFKTEHWVVTDNDFYYDGAVHHVLAAPKRHVLLPDRLTLNETRDLFGTVIPTLQTRFGDGPFTTLFRFGDTAHTGATVEHLHVHFIRGVEQSSKDHPPILAVVGFKKP